MMDATIPVLVWMASPGNIDALLNASSMELFPAPVKRYQTPRVAVSLLSAQILLQLQHPQTPTAKIRFQIAKIMDRADVQANTNLGLKRIVKHSVIYAQHPPLHLTQHAKTRFQTVKIMD